MIQKALYGRCNSRNRHGRKKPIGKNKIRFPPILVSASKRLGISPRIYAYRIYRIKVFSGSKFPYRKKYSSIDICLFVSLQKNKIKITLIRYNTNNSEKILFKIRSIRSVLLFHPYSRPISMPNVLVSCVKF